MGLWPSIVEWAEPMKSSSNRLVPALLFLAILVVAANAWFAFRAVTSLLNSEHAVEHTSQTANQVERIMSSAKDAETGTRGYLLTGDVHYLQPYRDAIHDLPVELDRFQSLTADNPSQQQRIAGMRAAIQQRLSHLQQSIDIRRTGSSDMVRNFLLEGTGKTEMDRLRGIADNMESEESRLLTIRIASAQSNGTRARLAVGLASILDFILIVLTFRYFGHERRLRIQSEVTAARLATSRIELVRRAEEISVLNATLEQRVQLRTAELESINRELEAFSYSVSHDLRAPLRTIDGFSLALEEDYAEAVGDTGRDYIHRVRSGVQRMGGLIDALLQLSRITRAEINREVFDISELAESVASALRDENPGRDMTFHIEPGLIAEGDPKLLLVALENLLGNAVKFSSRMPTTVVDFGWDKQQEAWFVRDNGAGFDMHYADKLFNAFNRLHGDKDFKGSGIGLATVARVIHRHHGRISADSVVHHGATFWFTLG
jgi:signal transduction histidine kinase